MVKITWLDVAPENQSVKLKFYQKFFKARF
jgi:hypothetical protein